MTNVENKETFKTYKCAICNKEHSTIIERAKCEQECFKKLELEKEKALKEKKKKEQEGRKAELDAAVKYAYELYNKYLEDYGSYDFEFSGEKVSSPFVGTFTNPFRLHNFLDEFWS